MPPKPAIIKSFRIFEFRTLDDIPKDASSSDSGSDPDETRYVHKKDENQFVIQMFAINERGETCCLYIQDYQPFFYIKVAKNWTKSDMYECVNELKNKLDKRYRDSVLEWELVDYQKLYGFTAGKKDRFIKVTFKNGIVMKKMAGLWYSYKKDSDNRGERVKTNYVFKGVELELYESTIPPLLRYFHINNISPSGWVCFKLNRAIKPQVQTTTCKYEYIIPLKELLAQPEKETRVPYKICSFDIEANSSHGDFPLAIKSYKRFTQQMVDAFLKQCKIISDVDKLKLLINKLIFSAFGYDKFEDIDFVYPKNMPTKQKLTGLIATLLNESLENAKKANSEEDNSNILKIDMMFEQMKNFSPENTKGNDDCADEEGAGAECNDGSTSYQSWQKKPRLKKTDTILDILTSESYDRDEKIQITNEVITRLFPRLEGDKVTFIGSTFLRYGDKEPYLNNCIVLNSCDPINGIEVECAETERNLLLKWTELIQRENPDIIIGFNTFGFDNEFLFRRAQENECDKEFLLLSRKIDELSAVASYDNPSELHLEVNKLKIASGEFDMRYFRMGGRLQIDMYAYFRKENFNFSSYKLDDVAGDLISDNISNVVLGQCDNGNSITELYSQNLMGLNVGDYIRIGFVGFTSDYYKDGSKFKVLEIRRNIEVTETVKGVETKKTYNVIVIGGHETIDRSKPIKWGMAKDDVNHKDIFKLSSGSSRDRAVVAKYCIQDCNLVHHLMNKIDVLTGFIEMANICSVPISFLIFRGQGIKLTSYVAKKCREKDIVMPDLEKTKSEEGFEGAIVLPPKCAMYMDNPVACVDYSSLYPSSMISQNFSHDSKVWSKEYDLEGNLIKITGERNSKGEFIYDNLPGYYYIDMEFDTYDYIRKKVTSRAVKTKVGRLVCRWAQFPDNKKGVMPAILEELLKARADTRKMIKTEKDPFMQNILDKRQNGYKVTANSLYGQCGSRTSTFYEKDVAASTTATGRMMIMYAKRIIEEVYGNNSIHVLQSGKSVKTNACCIYGDTDSDFFTFNLEDPVTGEKIRGKPALEITIELAQEVADLCTRYLKPPMALSYEKTLMPFILLSKKRYVGMLYETDPNKGKLKFMGLALKRRDSCDYLKDVYGGILKILMDTKNENGIKSAIEYLDNALTDLVKGKIPMDKLTITKQLRGYYKNPNQIAHKVLADRIGKRDPGNKPKPGDRMKFVHIVNEARGVLQGDKIETPEYIVENKLPLDYDFYVTNQLMKPIQQLFGLALEQIWELQNKRSAIKAYQKDVSRLEEEYPEIEIFMKQKEKYCATKVKILLFDKILTQITQQKNKMSAITSFFRPV